MNEYELERHFDQLEDQLHAEHHAEPCNCKRCRDVFSGDDK